MEFKPNKKIPVFVLAVLMLFASAFGGFTTALAEESKPAAPTGLQAGENDAGKVELSWEESAGVLGYVIYRANAADGEYQNLRLVTETSYTDATATPADGYFYKLTSLTIIDMRFVESEAAGPVQAGGAETPAEPKDDGSTIGGFKFSWQEGLDAEPTADGYMKLTWPAYEGVEEYAVIYSTSDDPMDISAYKNMSNPFRVSDTSYVYEDLQPDTTYCFAVLPLKNGQVMTTSGTTEVICYKPIKMELSTVDPSPAPTEQPAEPTEQPTAQPTEEPEPTVEPTAQPTEQPAEPTEQPTVQPTEEPEPTVEPTPIPTEQPSQTAQPEGDKPQAVPGITVSPISDTDIQIQWGAVPEATSYHIFRSINPNGGFAEIGSVPAGSTSFVDRGMQPTATYYYYVAAGRYGYYGYPSSIAWGCCGYGNGYMQISPYVSGSKSGYQLNWRPFGRDKKYYVYRSANGRDFAYIGSTSHTYYKDKKSGFGINYWYRVTEKYGGTIYGYTHSSNPWPYPPSQHPNMNLSVMSTGDMGTIGMRLVWNNVYGSTGYTIYRSTDGYNYSAVAAVPSYQTSFTDMPLMPGTIYHYKVVSSTGVESYGSAATVKQNLVLVGTPSGSGPNRGVQLRWNSISGATSYTIYRASVYGGQYTQVGVTETPFWLDTGGLTAMRSYYYRVVASNGAEDTVVCSTLW